MAELLELIGQGERIDADDPSFAVAHLVHQHQRLALPHADLHYIARQIGDQRGQVAQQAHMIMERQLATLHRVLGGQASLGLFEMLADQCPDLVDALGHVGVAGEGVEVVDG